MAITQTVFDNNTNRTGMARMVAGISYSAIGDPKTTLTLLRPWEEDARYPLVVFVQGSGWTTPDLGYELPQLARLAQEGYVVATVCHRDSTEGNPFPTYLKDVKTAIRFLRANAEKYSIDTDHVCIYGTSSGGNTALMVGATQGDPRFEPDEYPGVSDAVNCIVDCYGPTDLTFLLDVDEPFAPHFAGLIGENDPAKVLHDMSPVFYISKSTPFPPSLLVHGTADTVVTYDQSQTMADTLKSCGKDVQLLTVTDAPHEDTFWSWPLINTIYTFIREHI